MSSISIYGSFPFTTNGPFHYLYRITNLVEQKHYYGIRTSKNILPHQDLGVNYFSSSQDKEFIKDQKEQPQNYKYKVIIVAESRIRVSELETKIQRKFNVGMNKYFYNKVINTSTGFDPTGRVVVLDPDGNCLQVSVTDERYLNGTLVHILKGQITVKDEFGNTENILNTDERYLKGELQHILKGTHMGMLPVKDEFGNTEYISLTDERYLNGSLVHVHKGKATVRDSNGNLEHISITDERYLKGSLKGITSGYKWISNPELKINRLIEPNEPLPDGYFYGRGTIKSVQKGSKRIYNIELKKNMVLKPGDILPEGWSYGMKRVWD